MAVCPGGPKSLIEKDLDFAQRFSIQGSSFDGGTFAKVTPKTFLPEPTMAGVCARCVVGLVLIAAGLLFAGVAIGRSLRKRS